MPTRNLRWVNAFMAATNLAVIPALFGDHVLLSAAVSTASFMMHLSETKHGLPGIIGHSNIFLWADRAVAVGSIIYALNYTISRPITLIGLVCMSISEYRRTPLPVFIMFHTIWHCCIYYILYSMH